MFGKMHMIVGEKPDSNVKLRLECGNCALCNYHIFLFMISRFIIGSVAMKTIYTIGSLLLLGLKLQVYFLIKTLMGGIVLGIFPAFFGTFRILWECMSEQDIHHVYLKKELKKFDKKEFIKVNIIGYIFAVIIYILVLNMQISRYFIQINILHWFILFVLILIISIAIYVIALFTKYDLPIRQYIFQGFLCSIVGIFETIAIFLGFGLAIGIGFVIPPISFFIGIPLVILPHAWFSRAAVARFERVFYKKKIKR